MRVTIFGGHGQVALLLAPLLVEAGHEVTSVIRNPDHVEEVAATGASPLVQSLEESSTDELASILTGQDAVVWSAGAGGGDPARTQAVDRDAAVRAVEAAVAAEVERFVMVSFSGAFPEHLVASDDPFRAYMDAKIAADDHLRASELDWVVLGPGRLTDDPGTGAVDPAASFRDGDTSPRALVAQVAHAVLEHPAVSRRTLVFGAGDVPIGTWLDGLD